MYIPAHSDTQQAMPIDEWTSLIRSEYLSDFIKKGGAAVKFAVPLENHLQQELVNKLHSIAIKENYHYAYLKADITRIHKFNELFYAIAKQIDWDDLACNFLKTFVPEKYLYPENRSDPNIHDLYIPKLRNQLSQKNYTMTLEFRRAMFRLCLAQLDPEFNPAGEIEAIKLWFYGQLPRITALKEASIFQQIRMYNARDMLTSLSYWLHIAGQSGLVLIIDISRYFEAWKARNSDGTFYFRLPAVFNVYEVLRQFIDGTDVLHNCLIVVVAPPSFLDEDNERGIHLYEALRLRIWDDVNDRKKPNPLSSLIRLSGSPQQGSEEYSINLSQK